MVASESAPIIHFDRVLSTSSGVTDLEAGLAYARVTFDDEPSYHTGELLPPLYTAGLTIDSYFECHNNNIDPGAIVGQTGGAHAESDLYFHAPVHPGQKVTWSCSISGVSPSPAGTLTTIKMIVRDEDGAPLVTHLWTSIAIRGTTEFLGGEPLPDHRFPPEARARPIGTETFFIPDDHGEAYYQAAGDHAAHSRFLEQALAEGYPGLILQGMCSFGIATGAAVRLGGHGDSRRLRRLAARFSSPVLLGAELSVDVFDVGTKPDGTHEVAFEAHQGDTMCLSHGRAEFAPASS
jgi:acyl dehydratase